MSERTSKWPSTYVLIFVCSRPQCVGVVREDVDGTDGASSPGSKREGETGEAEERLELGGVWGRVGDDGEVEERGGLGSSALWDKTRPF